MQDFVPITRTYARTERVFAALADSPATRRYRGAKIVAATLAAVLALVLAYYVVRHLGTLPEVPTVSNACPSDITELPVGRPFTIPEYCFEKIQS